MHSKRNRFLQKTLLKIPNRPFLIGTLTAHRSLDSQIKGAVRTPIDLIELRLDTFPEINNSLDRAIPFSKKLILDLKHQSKLPLLLTIRSAEERGPGPSSTQKMSDQKRIALFKATLPYCSLVDLEIRHRALIKRVTPLAHQNGVDVIHSFHDFEGPGNLSQLTRLAQLSQKMKGDIFKVAVTPHNQQQLDKFLGWGLNMGNVPLVLIGMGSIGRPTRFLGYSFGSLLTYGHLGQEAAPGQVMVKKLYEAIRNIYC